jgi:transposase
MSMARAELPGDPAALRAFAASLQAELIEKNLAISARDAEIHAKTLHIEKLRVQLAILRRARFGRSSEKLDRDIAQLELLIGELEEGQAETLARSAAASSPLPGPSASVSRDRQPPGRKPLPEHLPRETVVHEPSCSCPSCGGTILSRIGEDEREVLEYVPSYFKVVRHLRPKLSCRACETIVQAPMPSLPIERGRPGPGLLAHVLVAKYWTTSPCTGRA